MSTDSGISSLLRAQASSPETVGSVIQLTVFTVASRAVREFRPAVDSAGGADL